MRMGLILSGLLHLTIIGFGIFTIAGARFDHEALDIEPIAIELAPIADAMALREGDKQASIELAAAPKPTEKPEINQQANHVGDGKVDSAAPLKPQERVREVEAPPPPEKTTAPPTQETAIVEKTTPPSEPVTPSQDMAKTEPEKATLPQEVAADEQPQATQPQQNNSVANALPQAVPQPRQKPKPVQAPPRQPATVTAPPSQQQGEKNLADILEKSAELIDRTPTQGGGMRRTQEQAGAGATRNIGDNRQLAQTIQNVIGGCIKNTANIGILKGSQSHDLVVRVHMRLNRDGSIDGTPDLTPSGGEAAEREIATTQGYAALARCAPFSGLPPERYDDGWFDVTINWRPLD